MHHNRVWLLAVFAGLLLQVVSGCRADKDPDKEEKYTGPIIETTDIHTLYSDSARLKIKLNAGLQQQFKNGDANYPKGLDMTFMEENGQVGSPLRPNYGKYITDKDVYVVRGNLI